MLPVILGTVALSAVGYGIKKCLSDESCVDSTKDVIQEGAMKAFEGIEAIEEAFGLNEYTFSKEETEEARKALAMTAFTSENESNQDNAIVTFYKLKEELVASSLKAFTEVIQKIENLHIEIPSEVKLHNDMPASDEHREKLHKTAHKLTVLLTSTEHIFMAHINKLTAITNVATDYNAYSPQAKKILSDTLVISNALYEILNVQLVNKNNKPSKAAKSLVIEIQKILYSFEKGEEERLVA